MAFARPERRAGGIRRARPACGPSAPQIVAALALALVAGSAANAVAADVPTPFPANAPADTPAEVERVTVTRSLRALAEVGLATTVISRREIAARGASSLADLLAEVPGLQVDQPGGRGGTASIYLRGADPNHTLVLVDGVAMNDPTNSRGGSFNPATLSADAIERIELLRTPVSALYGSGALAGVVNIVTRSAADGGRAEVRADGRGGAAWRLVQGGTLADASKVDGGAANPANPPAATWHFSAGGSDDPRAADGSRFRGNDLSLGFKAAPAPGMRLALDAGRVVSRGEAFPDDSGGPDFAVRRTTTQLSSTQDRAGVDLRRRLADGMDAEISYRQMVVASREDAPGVAPGLRDPAGLPASLTDSHFRREVAGALLQWAAAPDADGVRTTTVGIEATTESGSSRARLDFGHHFVLPAVFDRSRRSTALVADVGARIAAPAGGLDAHAALRVDHPDGGATRTSPALDLVWRAGGGFRIRAAATRGFQLPSFFALGHPLVGNPSLRPERSRSAEVGADWTRANGSLRVAATAFRRRVEGSIDFEAGPPPRLVNRDALRTQGVELEASMALGAVGRLSGNASALSPKIDGATAADAWPRNRPRRLASLNWTGTVVPGWTFGVHERHVGSRRDSSIPTGDVVLAAYDRVDVDLHTRFAAISGLDLGAGVRNLFGAKYQEMVGFPAQRIQVWVAVGRVW